MAGRTSKAATGSNKVSKKPKAQAKGKSSKKSIAKSSLKKDAKAVDKVISAAISVKKTKKIKYTKHELLVLAELENLAGYIDEAKVEISHICPSDVKNEYIPSAKDELDAVVEAAAVATNAIMDACEDVEGAMGDVSPEISDTLMGATTKIYEACTFQDITGQRINKVVKTMHHIEQRIDALVNAFGGAHKNENPDTKPSSKSDASEQNESGVICDEDLLEGPQLAEKAKNQTEIDDLLASFD